MIRMKNVSHVKERVLARIKSPSLFMKGMERAVMQHSSFLRASRNWCVIIKKNNVVIGRAVGSGNQWSTVLSSGQTPDYQCVSLTINM